MSAGKLHLHYVCPNLFCIFDESDSLFVDCIAGEMTEDNARRVVDLWNADVDGAGAKIPPQHPRPVTGTEILENKARIENELATSIGPKNVDRHAWLTEYREGVPANFTHGAVLLYRDYLTQKSWAASRLNELQASWKRFDAERTEHLLTQAKVTFWRVMSGAMALMLLSVWANTYLFGGA